MPVDFSSLQSIQTPREIAQLPETSGGSGWSGALKGLAGMLGSALKNPSTTGSTPSSSDSTSYSNPNTYGSGAALQGLQSQQPTIQSPQVAASQATAKGLTSQMQEVMPLVMKDLQSQGFQPVLASGFRTQAEQAEKVRQGASHTMHSQHMTGNAVDIVDRRYMWDLAQHPKEIAAFATAMQNTAAKYGLTSGTKWKSFGPYGDFAHLQYDPEKVQATRDAQKQFRAQNDPQYAAKIAQEQGTIQSQQLSPQVTRMQNYYQDPNAPRGLRNNNPGNIEKTDGKYGAEVDGKDTRFATYATPQQGLSALNQLLDRHDGDTLTRLISRYAPPNENNTKSYIAGIAKATGLDPNKPVDMSNPQTKAAIMKGIIQIENGHNPYPDDMINSVIGGQSQDASTLTSQDGISLNDRVPPMPRPNQPAPLQQNTPTAKMPPLNTPETFGTNTINGPINWNMLASNGGQQ